MEYVAAVLTWYKTAYLWSIQLLTGYVSTIYVSVKSSIISFLKKQQVFIFLFYPCKVTHKIFFLLYQLAKLL